MKLRTVFAPLVMSFLALSPLISCQATASEPHSNSRGFAPVKELDSSDLLAVAMDESSLFLVGDDGMLTVVSYQEDTPVVVSTTAFTNQPEQVVLDQGILAAALGEFGVELMDVSDPGAPLSIATISSVDGYPEFEGDGVGFGSNGELLVASGDNVHLFDITTPSAISILGTYTGERTARDLSVEDNQLAIGNRGFGFELVDVTNPSTPQHQAAWGERADQVTLVGTLAFTAAEEFETAVLRVIDVNPELEDPSELGSHDTYAGYDGEFTIPELVVNSEGTVAAFPFMWEHGEGSINYGIFVYDTSTPASTDEVAQLTLPSEPTDAALAGQIMAVTVGMQVVLYDLTDPSNPLELPGISTSVDDPTDEVALPTTPRIESVYPNPFNARTRVVFSLPASQQVRLAVYDMLGRERLLLADRVFEGGSHNVTLNTDQLGSGTYVFRLQTSQFQSTKKLVLIK
ncbi:T9SS type A sorting domain-containing protein [bacterium]|nr:T9SS type A sorting domain-containing protein [bacterium]